MKGKNIQWRKYILYVFVAFNLRAKRKKQRVNEAWVYPSIRQPLCQTEGSIRRHRGEGRWMDVSQIPFLNYTIILIALSLPCFLLFNSFICQPVKPGISGDISKMGSIITISLIGAPLYGLRELTSLRRNDLATLWSTELKYWIFPLVKFSNCGQRLVVSPVFIYLPLLCEFKASLFLCSSFN